MTLKEAKESFPVQLAEYAIANHLTEARAFLQVVGSTCLAWMELDRIISKVKSHHWQMTHKFRIKLPHSVEEALEIDKKLV